MSYLLITLTFAYLLLRRLTDTGRAYQAGYHQATQDAQHTLDVIDELKQNEQQEQATYTMGLN